MRPLGPYTLRTVVVSLTAVVLAVGLFLLCYRTDNKYNAPGPRGYGGVLLVEAEDLVRTPVFFLVSGWEIYRGELLEPEDFQDGKRRVKEDVFIGQYGGFEGEDAQGSPHGSATYALHIQIPSEPASYMLELPEIYSAYRLYVNGMLLESFGDPEPGSYRAETGNSAVMFQAQDRIELLVAVSDYSYLYSGMVYPPAFGTPRAVEGYLNARLALRVFVCAVACVVGAFYLALGFAARQSSMPVLYGLLCLCFVGYTAYPVRGALLRGGMLWYAVENLCFCGMYLLVMLLLYRLAGARHRIAHLFHGFGAAMMLCSVLVLFAPKGVLWILLAYSRLIDVYKWATAVYLTVSAALAIRRIRQGSAILVGVLFFDCALVMDRLLQNFEPILLGWFTEIAGAVLVVGIGVVMGQEVVAQYRERLALEGRVADVSRLVEMQRAYYPLLLEGIEEARAARHDLRHHLRVIRGFTEENRTEELRRYLESYEGGVAAARPLQYCAHHAADVVLRHFAGLCEQHAIRFEVDARVPEALRVADADLCAVLSNLLENGVEAAAALADREQRFVAVSLTQVNLALVVAVRNSFDGIVRQQQGRLLSRKGRGRQGVGTASVQHIAERYGGSARFSVEGSGRVFYSGVVLGSPPEQPGNR